MTRAMTGCIVFAAAVLAAASGDATTIRVYGVTTQNNSGGGPGDTLYASATIVPFDTSLGTLTSATIYVRGDGGAGLTLTNLLPGDYGWTGFVRISLIGPGGSVLFTARQAIDYDYRVRIDQAGDVWGCIGPDCVVPLPGVGIAPFTLHMSVGNSYGYNVDLYDNLEMFRSGVQLSATAQFEIPVRGPSVGVDYVVFPADSSGGFFGFYDFVEYTYTPIPEPSTALLLGVGLALMGASRARRFEPEFRLPPRGQR